MAKTLSPNKKTSEQFPYILGLDVGPNSIGWAVVECEIDDSIPDRHIDKETGAIKESSARYLPKRLHALNSRIFQERVDAKTRVPKNQKRRQMRGARRRLDRLQARRRKLVALLLQHQLLPKDFSTQTERLLNEIDLSFAERVLNKKWSSQWTVEDKKWISPYAMRAYSIDNALKPFEFGRLLLHLQRRRGYFSNRGIKCKELDDYLREMQPDHTEEHSDDLSKKPGQDVKETQIVLGGISKLQDDIRKLEARTLGEYIWKRAQADDMGHGLARRITGYSVETTRPRKTKPDGTVETPKQQVKLYAQRDMYESEFETIWKSQQEAKLKIAKLRQEVRPLLFFQRPLKSQKDTVGRCSLILAKRRAPLASLNYQEFRTRQMISNIEIPMPGSGDMRKLTDEEREAIYKMTQDPSKLNEQGRLSWQQVGDKFDVDKTAINYWRNNSGDAKTGVVGNRTILKICEVIDSAGEDGKKYWDDLGKEKVEDKGRGEEKDNPGKKKNDPPKTKQDALVELMLTTPNKLSLYKCLTKKWGMAEGPGKLAYRLTTCELEDDYGKYSSKALEILLPHMREGNPYHIAMGKARLSERETATTIRQQFFEIGKGANITNPVVDKALWEIRRVINALIKRHGFPAVIRVELAREMKESEKDRSDTEKRQAGNRKRNADAEAAINAYRKKGDIVGISTNRYGNISKSDRDKYKMWEYEQDHQCLFCGESISLGQLFSGDAEIEHIWPQTGFKQNYLNTTVACKTCNNDKGNHTPHQAWGSNQDRWYAIEKRVTTLKNAKKLPPGKAKRILDTAWQAGDESEFVERQLVDTAYIARCTKQLLEQTGLRVQVSRGGAVYILRRAWGVNNVLPKRLDEIAHKETGETDKDGNAIKVYDAKEAEQIKNRKDHRHHAIDAFMVAMTDHKLLMQLTKWNQAKNERNKANAQGKESAPKLELPKPKSWVDSKNFDALLKAKLLNAVVAHMAQRKVSGALHKDTAYGKSFYTKPLNLEDKDVTTIKNYLATDSQAEGDATWILDPEIRAILEDWVEKNEALSNEERCLPKNSEGVEMKEVVLAKRCYTIRKPVKDVLEYARKERIEGTGTWIVDKRTHDSLRQYCQKYTAKNVDLEKNPPRLLSKSKRPGEVLKRVTCARTYGAKSIALLQEHKIFALGNNHHVVIFDNGKTGKDLLRKASLISALDARQRIRRGEAIIQREPPEEWDGEWHYWMDLAINDMLYWHGDLSKKQYKKDELVLDEWHIRVPIFRVQKFSNDGEITLRHYSVSTTRDKWGQIRCSSPKMLEARKIYLGNLGWTPTEDQPEFLKPDT